MKSRFSKFLMIILAASLIFTSPMIEAKGWGAKKTLNIKKAKQGFISKFAGKNLVTKTKKKVKAIVPSNPRISAKKIARKIVRNHAFKHASEFKSIKIENNPKRQESMLIREVAKTIKKGEKKFLKDNRVGYRKGTTIVIYNPNVSYKGTTFHKSTEKKAKKQFNNSIK